MSYMSAPLSIRFDESLLDRLRRRAKSVPGSTPSGLAQMLIDEGLRMAEHPGVAFRDGPSGRRASIASGPDIWEIIKYLKEIDERGPAALSAAAADMSLALSQVQLAVDYYLTFPNEINDEIAAADEASRAAEQGWRTRQRLLA